ncbi:HAD-IIB family hydrolase [Mycoplasma buteonis]|uniref:HAD-IIB family hydrolase n=1 Tax=Mycoplasma buteonis TaxID=171280 RepID=UPI00068E7EFB|nr:HAD-IIB family hydrolase [Mycoplasma buteonis]
MNKPSIVFLDLDGTTLDGPAPKWFMKDPSDFTCDVLSKVNKLFPVVICTGRSANNNTRRIVEKIGLDSYITWNGAEIYWHNQLIHKTTAPADVVKKLSNDLRKFGLNVIFNSKNQELSFTPNFFTRMFMSNHYRKWAKSYSQIDFNSFEMQKAFVLPTNPWSAKKLQKAFPKLKEKYKDVLELTLAGDKNNAIEITPQGISKGNAELFLCNYLNLDPSKAIHFGDSLNDASTKGKIGKLIAVGNAHDDLKVQADEVLERTCDESAVAHYLKQYLD